MPFGEMMGAFGDRTVIPNTQPYAHNIVLEIVLTFCKTIGLVIFFWIIRTTVYVLTKEKSIGGILTIAFGCFSMCRLFFPVHFGMNHIFGHIWPCL